MNSIKERIGFVVGNGHSMNAATAITKILIAEAAGLKQIWMNQEYLDTLMVFAAAASKTSAVRLGTAVIQTYPRHVYIWCLLTNAQSPLRMVISSADGFVKVQA
jgi:hypothetical protein